MTAIISDGAGIPMGGMPALCVCGGTPEAPDRFANHM